MSCYLCNDVTEHEQDTTVCETCYELLEEENKKLKEENECLHKIIDIIQKYENK